jgi:hypothetical protein
MFPLPQRLPLPERKFFVDARVRVGVGLASGEEEGSGKADYAYVLSMVAGWVFLAHRSAWYPSLLSYETLTLAPCKVSLASPYIRCREISSRPALRGGGRSGRRMRKLVNFRLGSRGSGLWTEMSFLRVGFSALAPGKRSVGCDRAESPLRPLYVGGPTNPFVVERRVGWDVLRVA